MFLLLLVSLANAETFSTSVTVAAAGSISACEGGAVSTSCKQAVADPALTKPEQEMLKRDCVLSKSEACSTDWLKIYAARETWTAQGVRYTVLWSAPKPAIVVPPPPVAPLTMLVVTPLVAEEVKVPCACTCCCAPLAMGPKAEH